MLKSHRVTALAIAAVLTASGAMAQQTEHGGKPITVQMNGASEVPKMGDPDGTGTAKLTFNPGQEQICYELSVQGIATANAAHIHAGAAGKSGGVKVPLEAPKADGKSKACATVDNETLKQIMDNPSGYYVNVHNAEYPDGALRGQLTK
jgi:hypothetical protein